MHEPASDSTSLRQAARQIEKVRAPKTAELVATQLRRRIARGELCADDALPGETQLMQQFGVSRPTLREAFRILESESLIEIRRGARGGPRIRLPNPRTAARYAALLLEVSGATLADVNDARLAIEPAAARLVAEQRSPEVIKVLRRVHEEELQATNNVATRAAASARFHATLVECCGNTTLAMLIGMLGIIIDNQNARFIAGLSRKWQGYRGEYLHVIVQGHERLLELIEAGDGPAAEQHWRQHMHDAMESVRSLLGDIAARPLVDVLSDQ
jgi:GntR family transcriptional regulator, transcriptional repressor for pyruvate dehydrogenase complex